MLNLPAIHEAIDAFIATNPTESYKVHIEKDDRQRTYLGLSGIGEPCMRKVWYQWRHCAKPTFPPRIHRLFRRGDREEFVFVWMLRGIGFEIFEIDEDGKQFSVSDFEGHVKGNLDGVAKIPKKFWVKGHTPAPVLTEYKTASDKKFKEFKKLGVQKANPKYYGQLQSYMGYMDLVGALFCVVNKNDDEIHMEFIPFDKYVFRRLVDKAGDIVHSQEAPPGISNNASWYECRFCDFHGICHKKEPSQKICRTCKFATPGPDKSWNCEKGEEYGTVCGKWEDIAK